MHVRVVQVYDDFGESSGMKPLPRTLPFVSSVGMGLHASQYEAFSSTADPEDLPPPLGTLPEEATASTEKVDIPRKEQQRSHGDKNLGPTIGCPAAKREMRSVSGFEHETSKLKDAIECALQL